MFYSDSICKCYYFGLIEDIHCNHAEVNEYIKEKWKEFELEYYIIPYIYILYDSKYTASCVLRRNVFTLQITIPKDITKKYYREKKNPYISF